MYRLGSYFLDAIGESSEWIVMINSKGLAEGTPSLEGVLRIYVAGEGRGSKFTQEV